MSLKVWGFLSHHNGLDTWTLYNADLPMNQVETLLTNVAHKDSLRTLCLRDDRRQLSLRAAALMADIIIATTTKLVEFASWTRS